MERHEFQNIHDQLINLVQTTDNLEALRNELDHFHPFDIASILADLDNESRAKIYSIYNNEELAEIFTFIDSDETSEIVEDMNHQQLASIINEMEPDDAADIINEIDEEQADIIFDLLDSELSEEVKDLVAYKENTAGAIMNSNYIEIESGKDVKEIMKRIVKMAPEVESINTSFVVDPSGRLLGTLDLRKIIVTKSPCLVDEIMNVNFQSVEVNNDLNYVLKFIKDYDIYDLPVLENGILKGIITMDDALFTLIEESREDIAKLGGLSDAEDIDESIYLSVKKRLPWLAILLVLDIIVSVIISQFDYLFKVDALTILVVFQPIILGLAGNAGTQSLGITIRKISKHELDHRQGIVKHLLKEFFFGLMTGLILGILSFGLTYLFLAIKGNSELSNFEVAIVVSFSLAVSLTSANFFGSLIPIFFNKIKIDPAAASGPLITTCIDIIAVIIYFTLATTFLYNQIL